MTVWGFWVVAALSKYTNGLPCTLRERMGKSSRNASTENGLVGPGFVSRLEDVMQCLLDGAAVWQSCEHKFVEGVSQGGDLDERDDIAGEAVREEAARGLLVDAA